MSDIKVTSTHSLERTSPTGPGQKFVGRCRLCGKEGLDIEGVFEECPNPRGLSEAEALLEAIEGDGRSDT